VIRGQDQPAAFVINLDAARFVRLAGQAKSSTIQFSILLRIAR
jgi:hypothetical protein